MVRSFHSRMDNRNKNNLRYNDNIKYETVKNADIAQMVEQLIRNQ